MTDLRDIRVEAWRVNYGPAFDHSSRLGSLHSYRTLLRALICSLGGLDPNTNQQIPVCTYCSWTRYVQYGYRIYRYEQQMIGGTVRLVVQAICSTLYRCSAGQYSCRYLFLENLL
jgi:hypothetical protein